MAKGKKERSEAEFKQIFDAMQQVNEKWLALSINFVTYMQSIDNNYQNFGWTPEEYHLEVKKYIKKQQNDDNLA
jgi:hypothetical protein